MHDMLKKRKVQLAVLVIILITFFYCTRNQDSLEEETLEVLETTTSTTIEAEEKKENQEIDYNLQSQFNKEFKNAKEVIDNCKSTLAQLFSRDENDNLSMQYKSLKDASEKIADFYYSVGQKSKVTEEITKFITSPEAKSLDSKETIQKLSALGECGDFDESDILDESIEYLADYPSPPHQKSKMIKFILREFLKQLKLPIGLHQVHAKIEAIETLVEESLIPTSFQEDINNLRTLINDSQRDILSQVPSINSGGNITLSDLAEMKKTEKYYNDSIKLQFEEILETISSNL